MEIETTLEKEPPGGEEPPLPSRETGSKLRGHATWISGHLGVTEYGSPSDYMLVNPFIERSFRRFAF